jgi:hypothetical protein
MGRLDPRAKRALQAIKETLGTIGPLNVRWCKTSFPPLRG